MTYRLQLMQPTVTVNDYGEEAVVYTVTKTVHAERVRISGRRSEEVREHFPDYSVRYNIRNQNEVDENWRVQEVGGHLYTVTNIEPYKNRGMLQLICERVNE